MTTRLTRALVAETIDKIIAGTTIPQRKVELMEQAKARAVEIIKSGWPPRFEQCMKEYPKEWFPATSHLTIELGGWTQCLWPGEHWQTRVKLHDPVYHTMGGHPSVVDGTKRLAEALEAPCLALIKEEAGLRESLRTLVAAHKTVESLLKQAPELEPYLPALTPSTSSAVVVLASNVLAQLQSSGFQVTGGRA